MTATSERGASTHTAGYEDVLRRRIGDSIAAKQALLADPAALAALAEAAATIVSCLRAGGTVFFCGNGGSAVDCEHLSAELLGRFYRDRPALASVNLSSNVAALTAIGNDYAYEEVFARQLVGLGRAGDVLIGLSTSGRSRNVVRAFEVAADRGLHTIAFTGAAPSPLGDRGGLVFRAPSTDTPRVQECHMLAGHTLCEIVEDQMWPAP